MIDGESGITTTSRAGINVGRPTNEADQGNFAESANTESTNIYRTLFLIVVGLGVCGCCLIAAVFVMRRRSQKAMKDEGEQIEGGGCSKEKQIEMQGQQGQRVMVGSISSAAPVPTIGIMKDPNTAEGYGAVTGPSHVPSTNGYHPTVELQEENDAYSDDGGSDHLGAGLGAELDDFNDISDVSVSGGNRDNSLYGGGDELALPKTTTAGGKTPGAMTAGNDSNINRALPGDTDSGHHTAGGL